MDVWGAAVLMAFLFVSRCDAGIGGINYEERAVRIVDSRSNFPRLVFFTNDFSFDSITSNFCASPNGCVVNGEITFDSCQWSLYLESILLLPLLFVLIGILGILAGIVFWSFRACCFGGCNPSKGCCCPGEKLDISKGEGYTKCVAWSTKISIYTLTFGSCVALIALILGNSNVTSTVDGVSYSVLNASGTILDSLVYIDEQLVYLESLQLPQYQENISAQLEPVLDTMQEAYDTIDSTFVDVSYYNTWRAGVTLACSCLPIALALLASVGAIFGFSKLVYPFAISGVFFVFLSWLLFAIHFSLGTALADGIVLSREANSQNLRLSDLVFDCDNNTDLQEMEQLAYDGLDDTVAGICSLLDEMCNQVTIPCNSGGTESECHVAQCPADPSQNCTSDNVLMYQSIIVADILQGCADPTYVDPQQCPGENCSTFVTCVTLPMYTIEYCQDNCSSGEMQNASLVLANSFLAYDLYVDLLYEEVLPIVNCSIINGMYDDLYNLVTVSAMVSVNTIAVAEFFAGIAFLGLWIATIFGVKRVSKAARKGYSLLSTKEPGTQNT